MDFLRSCMTNVYAIDGILKTPFRLFSWHNEEFDYEHAWKRTRELLLDLRRQGLLCTAMSLDIWIFGDLSVQDGHAMEMLSSEFTMKEQGSLGEAMSRRTSHDRLLSDLFLESIEKCLAYRLETEMKHVGPWTWLCSEAETTDCESQGDTLLQLSVRVDRDGLLYMMPRAQSSHLRALKGFQPAGEDIKVILAPFGEIAVTHSTGRVTSSLSPTWRPYAEQILRLENIQVMENAQWTDIRLDDNRSNIFAWPTDLCFVFGSTCDLDAVYGEDVQWSHWFDVSEDVKTFKAPFAAAEEWHTASVKQHKISQENDLSKAHPSFETGNSGRSAGDTSAALDVYMVTSPLLTQRAADQQAVAGGIYPTPPDGLAQSTGLTQASSDSANAINQIEQGDPSNIMRLDGFQLGEHDLGSSASQPEYLMSHGDLFGDSEEIEFGDNEIGDADFSFFDEPDEEIAEDADMQDAPEEDGMEPDTTALDQSGSTEEVVRSPLLHYTYDSIDTRPQKSMDFHLEGQSDLIRSPTERVGPAELTIEQKKPEKPLSPFGIKERLLPPPVPASLAHKGALDTSAHKKLSTFSPVAFRDGLQFSRYSNVSMIRSDSSTAAEAIGPNIQLPPSRKKPRKLKLNRTETSEDVSLTSGSEDDSYESSSSASDSDMPPKLPWNTKKRKRRRENEIITPTATSTIFSWPNNNETSIAPSILSDSLMLHLLDGYTQLKQEHRDGQTSSLSATIDSLCADAATISISVRPMEALFEVADHDLIYIAQLVNEQAVSTTMSATQLNKVASTSSNQRLPSQWRSFHHILEKLVVDTSLQLISCDLSKVALAKESLSRAMTSNTKPHHGQTRHPQRSDSVTIGPDCFSISAPYIKLQRGSEDWEMFPPCLSFWETLGLGPAGGTKSVRAFCMFPLNDDVQCAAERFMIEMATAYEGCKLGSHSFHRNIDTNNDLDNYEDGMVPVEMTSDFTLEAALKAFRETSIELGLALTSMADIESDRTVVVYIINPFVEREASHYLCACFWQLFSTYRDNLTRTQQIQGARDVVLQIIPIHMIARPGALVLPEAREMSLLAREVYDRCPPSSSKRNESASVLPLVAAHSIELASSAAKKVSFQLTSIPPSDLMHEGSYLHLAYSRSHDGQWMSVAWLDNTGQYQNRAAFCVRGRSLADTVAEIWERTREILAARQITWRVLIVTDNALDQSTVHCWQSTCSQPRPQMLGVTLLSVQRTPLLTLAPPVETHPGLNNSDASTLTPVSTPQAATFTNSPDVNGFANAPPTPAPSESAASIAENDSDAHLVDVTDETWAMLLSSQMLEMSCPAALASGVLFRRGDAGSASDAKLPSIGVSLHWTIQIRSNGSVEEGQARHAELTMREVLKLYRNLAVLTEARGLDNGETAFMPVHLAVAVRGAAGLNGFLQAA